MPSLTIDLGVLADHHAARMQNEWARYLEGGSRGRFEWAVQRTIRAAADLLEAAYDADDFGRSAAVENPDAVEDFLAYEFGGVLFLDRAFRFVPPDVIDAAVRDYWRDPATRRPDPDFESLSGQLRQEA